MKRVLPLFLLFFLAAGCGGGDSNNAQFLAGTASNILPVSVSSDVCSGSMNSPCVKVTICDPNLAICQTIPDILVDTGSSGLRVFKSALDPSLQSALAQYPVTFLGNLLAECLPFADFTADWGGVQFSGVILGNEPAVTVPIQVIDSTFGGVSTGQSACGSSVTLLRNPAQAGSNGILGLDLFQYDMGNYFYCNPSGCTALSGPPPTPVQNPVFLLPVDYNGIILTFPNIPSSGAASLTGLLTLGIGTRSNNQAGPGLSVFPVNLNFSLTTAYGASLYPKSYIDSGTNLFVVPDLSIRTCTNPSDFGFFCPSSTQNLGAWNQLLNGAFEPVPFQIANTDLLLATGNLIFNNIGLPSNSPGRFIWGFPFFLGKTIYFGYDHSPTPLGTGPFWAY